jgi:hypothetical protein
MNPACFKFQRLINIFCAVVSWICLTRVSILLCYRMNQVIKHVDRCTLSFPMHVQRNRLKIPFQTQILIPGGVELVHKYILRFLIWTLTFIMKIMIANHLQFSKTKLSWCGCQVIWAKLMYSRSITRRKICIFDCSLQLNFSCKRHFATKIFLVA